MLCQFSYCVIQTLFILYSFHPQRVSFGVTAVFTQTFFIIRLLSHFTFNWFPAVSLCSVYSKIKMVPIIKMTNSSCQYRSFTCCQSTLQVQLHSWRGGENSPGRGPHRTLSQVLTRCLILRCVNIEADNHFHRVLSILFHHVSRFLVFFSSIIIISLDNVIKIIIVISMITVKPKQAVKLPAITSQSVSIA